ncbi:MAG: hypothetical protein K8R85_14805, partial [Bacteroidetes bacterium]|nr:hypothetical protein [Bacteroidota bacterium]
GSILEHFGEKIEVVGRIDAVKSNTTKYGDPYTFLNFGVWPAQTFTIVIWQEGIAALKANGISPSSLVGKWVSVTGVIASYGNKPQTVIELPNQIQILASEAEANQRLKLKPSPTVAPPTHTIKKVADKEANVFNDLYKNKPVYTPPKTVVTPTPKTTYKTPTPTYSSSSQTTKRTTSSTSGNSGCMVLLIFAIVGVIAITIASSGKMWYTGAIGGVALGNWVQSWFKV